MFDFEPVAGGTTRKDIAQLAHQKISVSFSPFFLSKFTKTLLHLKKTATKNEIFVILVLNRSRFHEADLRDFKLNPTDSINEPDLMHKKTDASTTPSCGRQKQKMQHYYKCKKF